MRDTMDFLIRLRENNNREWFTEHKAEYKKLEAKFHDFVEKLIVGISSFDASAKKLTVKDCTYRIYRDTRFSTDKTPYKTHIGAYICPGGKKSGNAGYYFHIEPKGEGLLGGNLFSAGLYMPEKEVLKSVREDILYKGDEFLATVKKAKGFTLSTESALKRAPAGFPPDSPYVEYLKLRDIHLMKIFDDNFLFHPHVLENTINAFKVTVDFMNFLNRAANFVHEEKME